MPSEDELKIVLHIGGAKCGSSAIQAYLAKNASALAARGLGVPGTALDFESHVTGEQIWFFEDMAASRDFTGLAGKIENLCKAARSRRLSTLVISAENICNHPELAKVFASVLASDDVRVVFYVRRQDDFLISSWQQWNLKRFASVGDFLTARAGKDARWLTMICPWADAFGDDRVAVRPFIRKRLRNGDVIDDFFHLIGISQEGLTSLSRNANPSFDEALARLAHRVRDVFDGPHDNRFYDVMARLLGEAALKKGSASSLLDLETRCDIYATYANENEALKARFLPDLGEGPLFDMPCADDVIERAKSEQLSDEIAMLTRAVYALAARLEGSKP
jgi:hypothetical protein